MSSNPSQGRRARHQIDHRGAGAQLHELGLFEPALDVAAQHLSVKLDRAIEIGDPQHQMIKPGDANRPGLHCLGPFQIRCVRHFRLHSVAMIIVPHFGRGYRYTVIDRMTLLDFEELYTYW